MNYIRSRKALVTKKVKDLCNPLFGERNVDIIQEITGVYVTIRFREITIKNEKESHLIRDLYVRFYIALNGNQHIHMMAELQGMRGTLTLEEELVGYGHSHLSPKHYNFLNTFCLGGINTPIHMLMTMLRSDFTWDTFETFLYHLKPYLEWESIAGTPHILLSTIGLPAAVDTSDAKGLSIKAFLKQARIQPPLLTYKYSGNTSIKIVLAEGEELRKQLLAASIIKGVMVNNLFVTAASQYHKLKLWLRAKKRHKGPTALIFKGKAVVRTILKPKQEEVAKEQEYTHAEPTIAKYIITTFNKYLLTYSYENQEEIQYKGAAISNIPSGLEIKSAEDSKAFGVEREVSEKERAGEIPDRRDQRARLRWLCNNETNEATVNDNAQSLPDDPLSFFL
jgi:hypothetical protein